MLFGLLLGHRLGMPGGVFLVNDGMPTQMPSARRERGSPRDSIGIIDGRVEDPVDEVLRVQLVVPLANVVRLARWVRFGP